MKHQISPQDILSYAAYEAVRAERRKAIIDAKRDRRLSVGPYATFYFENYDTMWLQIQEMLRIEKGGEEQLADELRAYNPMVPNGRELTATVMFEIEDVERRKQILGRLGGVENHMEIRVAGEAIKGAPEVDLDYTSAEGKASSVQFVHFQFTPEQIAKFSKLDQEAVVAITHPHYGHMAVIPPAVRKSLIKDFD